MAAQEHSNQADRRSRAPSRRSQRRRSTCLRERDRRRAARRRADRAARRAHAARDARIGMRRRSDAKPANARCATRRASSIARARPRAAGLRDDLVGEGARRSRASEAARRVDAALDARLVERFVDSLEREAPMANETLARRYAIAVVHRSRATAASPTASAPISTSIAQAIGDGDPRTRFLRLAGDRAGADKERLLTEPFDGRVDRVALHTLLLLVRKRRESLLDELVTRVSQAATRRRAARSR